MRASATSHCKYTGYSRGVAAEAFGQSGTLALQLLYVSVVAHGLGFSSMDPPDRPLRHRARRDRRHPRKRSCIHPAALPTSLQQLGHPAAAVVVGCCRCCCPVRAAVHALCTLYE